MGYAGNFAATSGNTPPVATNRSGSPSLSRSTIPAPPHVSRLHAQPARHGCIVEITLAVVAVQDAGVVREVRLEQVEAAVEIVVADPHTHARLHIAILVQRDPAAHADLAERPVVIVAKQKA